MDVQQRLETLTSFITIYIAAQRVEKPSTATKSWMVMSTLPAPFRTPEILPPSKAPTSFLDSTYTALYTFIIAVITLSGGSILEQKLDRYLKRTNIEQYTPIDRTDRLLQRLCKEGYLVRNKEMDGNEEVIEYIIGPRGKIEVGESGVSGLVRKVYGRDISAEGEASNDDFEARLARSVGAKRTLNQTDEALNAAADGDTGQSNRRDRRRSTRHRGARNDDDADYRR